LLALGVRDPVERISAIKENDEARHTLAELFQTWHSHHGDAWVAVNDLAEPVRRLLTGSHRESRQFVARRLQERVGARLAGFVLVQRRGPGKWTPATYCVQRTSS
jgi:hypothetical protein